MGARTGDKGGEVVLITRRHRARAEWGHTRPGGAQKTRRVPLRLPWDHQAAVSTIETPRESAGPHRTPYSKARLPSPQALPRGSFRFSRAPTGLPNHHSGDPSSRKASADGRAATATRVRGPGRCRWELLPSWVVPKAPDCNPNVLGSPPSPHDIAPSGPSHWLRQAEGPFGCRPSSADRMSCCE